MTRMRPGRNFTFTYGRNAKALKLHISGKPLLLYDTAAAWRQPLVSTTPHGKCPLVAPLDQPPELFGFAFRRSTGRRRTNPLLGPEHPRSTEQRPGQKTRSVIRRPGRAREYN